MHTDKSVAVGVEITGSRATVALVDRWGKIHHRCYAKTLWGRPAAATLELYLRAVDALLSHAHTEGFSVSGIGVSIPGSLDQTSRQPLLIPALPSLNSFPLCDLLEARYRLPAHLHVDVDAALLGEYRFGAGKGLRRLLFLTVSAVVGAAVAIDGKLERSTMEYVGHVSHIPVATNGPRCSCGKRGCINTLVSVDAMQKMIQRAVRRGEQTSLVQRLLNREYFSPQLLAEEAVRGDSVALQVYSEVGRWLSAAVMQYVSIFEPQTLILGGDVLSAGDLLLTQVRAGLLSQSSTFTSMVSVVPARLGSDAALLGVVIPCFPTSTSHAPLSRDAMPQVQRQRVLAPPLLPDDAETEQLPVIDAVADVDSSWLVGSWEPQWGNVGKRL